MLENLTVIVITYQEEKNIAACLESIFPVTKNVFVVDSFSTDKTQSILKQYDVKFCEYEFISYKDKREWAQNNNPFDTEWVFHIDADERFTPELQRWLLTAFEVESTMTDGFMFSRKTLFMDKWIRFGDHYPNFHLNLFKSSQGYVEEKAYDNHFVVRSGATRIIKGADIINIVADSIDTMIKSHNKYASVEADEIISGIKAGEIRPNLFGNPIERKRWLKVKVFESTPLFVRAFAYFIYRYVFRLGFLDGREGLIFHVLQGFWFRFLVDAKVYERRKYSDDNNT